MKKIFLSLILTSLSYAAIDEQKSRHDSCVPFSGSSDDYDESCCSGSCEDDFLFSGSSEEECYSGSSDEE